MITAMNELMTVASAAQAIVAVVADTAATAGDAVPAAAPTTDVAADALGGVREAHDNFGFWALFLRADLVVKSVMLVLIFASFWSWAIIFDKWRKMRRVRSQADTFEDVFWSGRSLDELYDVIGKGPDHPLAQVFVAAMREWHRSREKITTTGLSAGLQQRVDRVMSVTVNREMEKVERYLSFLATVGSTAPFIGLFGTVWGIMNSFQQIAVSNNTSLAVVAPGIAEALFATALGLVAAIPATVAFNKFSNDMGRYAGRLEGFADEFHAILSRQLEDRS